MLYRIPREGPRSGSTTQVKGLPRPHPVSQRGNHPAGRLPGSQATERKKRLLTVASVPMQESASSRQHGFVLGKICLLTRQKRIRSCGGIRGTAMDDRVIPDSSKRQTENTYLYSRERRLIQNLTLRKAIPSLVQDHQNLSPDIRVFLLEFFRK